MAKYIRSQWIPSFWKQRPFFDPIQLLDEPLSQYINNWPSLADLQDLIDHAWHPIHTLSGNKLTVVPQDDKPQTFEEHYAPRIYLRGEIQTRTENWHDFFQVISWILFPATKAAINARHYHAAKHRTETLNLPGRRNPVENLLSLFDECGAIVVSSNPALLQSIVDFQWKELFWRQRGRLQHELSCIVFGHAFNEKLIKPYIGMTANSLLLALDKTCMGLPPQELLQIIDQQLARCIMDATRFTTPHDLTPFPVLGLPGWHWDNKHEQFYDNADYFRKQRRRLSNPHVTSSKIIYVQDNCESG